MLLNYKSDFKIKRTDEERRYCHVYELKYALEEAGFLPDYVCHTNNTVGAKITRILGAKTLLQFTPDIADSTGALVTQKRTEAMCANIAK